MYKIFQKIIIGPLQLSEKTHSHTTVVYYKYLLLSEKLTHIVYYKYQQRSLQR